jgi:serine/threonine protein kinase
VHRDININNLLISDDDILKISDFGVSMIIEDNDLIPVNSGPTTYTPPEKKFNDYPFYNGKPADIWCCGVALYHMVYKRQLFKNFVNMDRNDYHVILPDDPEEIIDQNLKDLMINLLDVNPKNRSTFNDIKVCTIKNFYKFKNFLKLIFYFLETSLDYKTRRISSS